MAVGFAGQAWKHGVVVEELPSQPPEEPRVGIVLDGAVTMLDSWSFKTFRANWVYVGAAGELGVAALDAAVKKEEEVEVDAAVKVEDVVEAQTVGAAGLVAQAATLEVDEALEARGDEVGGEASSLPAAELVAVPVPGVVAVTPAVAGAYVEVRTAPVSGCGDGAVRPSGASASGKRKAGVALDAKGVSSETPLDQIRTGSAGRAGTDSAPAEGPLTPTGAGAPPINQPLAGKASVAESVSDSLISDIDSYYRDSFSSDLRRIFYRTQSRRQRLRRQVRALALNLPSDFSEFSPRR